jgi:multidrug efflux pump
MFITDFAIKRPVFSVALSLMIIVVGFLSYMNLSLQQYPTIEEPVLTITTIYRGAAPSVIESKITTILEEELSNVAGLDYMQSASKTGESTITMHFRENISVLEALSDIRDKIGQAQSRLPKDCFSPVISKTEVNDYPFMYLMLTSPTLSELDLFDYADRNLKPLFESLPGVGNARIFGNNITMQILLDREKLKAYNLAITDVLQAITAGSQELPSGSIVKGHRYVNVILETALTTPEAMANLIIANKSGHLVCLKDVGTIKLGKDENEFEILPRFNKGTVSFLAIKKAFGGNILSISKAAHQLLGTLQQTLPKDMHLGVGYDISMFIDASIKAVANTLVEAIILVLLIILFFLHSFRAALIPLITIPVSLIGSLAFLLLFGCSLNTITLLAMVLSIGLVVDDAIIVLENIHQYIERGFTPLEAAFKGAREVGFAVIAMTITLASVYTPIAFVQGLTGALFSEFAVALAGAVLVSGVVALTLSPMMCSKLLRPHSKENSNRFSLLIEEGLQRINELYQRSLIKVIARPKALLGGLVIILIGSVFLFKKLPSELAPLEDQGLVFAAIQGPPGATLDSMLGYATQLEDILTSVPEYEGVWTVIQRSSVFAGITLKPWSKRKRGLMQIIGDLSVKAMAVPGLQINIFPPLGLMTGGESGLQIGVKTIASYSELSAVMEKALQKIRASNCFDYANQDLVLGTPQLMVEVDRHKAALLGTTLEDISKTLETMLSGNRTFKFEKQGKHYDIVISAKKDQAKDLQDIGSFYVKSTVSPELIPLSNLTTVREIAVPKELTHLNKMRCSILTNSLKPTCHTADGLAVILKALEDLPSSCQWEPLGNLRKYIQSQGSMYLIFFAALFFIYLVLAIQFESLIDPLLIMITVPLSMGGALLALYLSGGTLNIFSQVGLITLVGLITKHGILLVEFANKQQDAGLSAREAVLKAASLRLRPILMTTGAMVLGAIPLALASGAGAESRQQIGWVLVGGLLGGTFFTLFVVPFVYSAVKGRMPSLR